MTLRYFAQRIALSVPVLLSVVTLIFFVIRALPGDPAQAALGDNASRAAVEALRARLGLDVPPAVQYVRFLADLLRGDLGRSFINGVSVGDQVAYNLPFTVQLAVSGLVIALSAGIPVAAYTATHPNRIADTSSRMLSLVGISMPAFLLGVLLMLLFGVQLRWLPIVGGGSSDSLADRLLHLLLPALALGLVMSASITRLTRAAMLAVLSGDYVRTARAKGVQERMVILVHTLRPALVPVVSLTGVWAVALVGDSVTTEVVFSRPGLGKMLVSAVLQRDYTSLQSVMVVYAAFVVIINLLTDVAYALLDPRIRISVT